MYTSKEASQLLNIPESTVRRLAKQFSTYLSPHEPSSRKRRYTERDISIIQKARELLERGYTVKLVSAELEKIVELLEPEPEPPAPTLEPEPDSSPVMRQLAIIDKQYTGLLAELEKLRQAQEASAERLARFEQLERWAALPWWRRLFSSPPKE